jgi:hypothetical protein
MSASYEEDLYTWSLEQTSLLRAHKFDQIDLEHIIEEIEDMSKSEKRALQSFLETLLMQLLKWQYQGRSWKFTIIEQRKRIKSHLEENRGLKSKLPELIEKAYDYAVTGAVRETGLDIKVFPQECPWSYEQFINPDFWPEVLLN